MLQVLNRNGHFFPPWLQWIMLNHAPWVTKPSLQESSFKMFGMMAHFLMCPTCFFFRAMTSVSWVHQRQRMLTGCFVVSWEPFTCSAKHSTRLRSLPSTNSAQDTRWDNAHVLPYHPLHWIFSVRFTAHQCHALFGRQNILATQGLDCQCYLMLSLTVHIVS